MLNLSKNKYHKEKKLLYSYKIKSRGNKSNKNKDNKDKDKEN